MLCTVCMDLAYNLHFKPVQYMFWYTTSDIYIRLRTDWDGETEHYSYHLIACFHYKYTVQMVSIDFDPQLPRIVKQC